jgi:aspartyl aminopeptidase
MIKNIKSNGMIVIEDTNSSYMDGFGNKKYSFINYIKNKIDKMNYRFHRLNKKKSENNFWSLRIYESIVAICVNDNFEKTKSILISNNGIDSNAEDIRVKKNLHKFNYLSKFFIFMYSRLFNYKKKIDIKKYFD